MFEVARQPHVHDEIVTVTLVRGNHPGEPLGDHHRMSGITATALTDLPGHKGARLQGDDPAPLALLHLHRRRADRAMIGLGQEIDTREVCGTARCRSHYFGGRPACPAGMMMKPAQQFIGPPFLPTSSSS